MLRQIKPAIQTDVAHVIVPVHALAMLCQRSWGVSCTSELLPVVFEERLVDLVDADDGEKDCENDRSWLRRIVGVERPVCIVVLRHSSLLRGVGPR